MKTSQPSSEPTFNLFSAEHWIALTLIVAIAIGFALLLRATRRKPGRARLRATACIALALTLFVAQFGNDVAEIILGRYSILRSLPLHLCDLGAFACALALILCARKPHAESLARWHPLFELAYFWGLSGTLQALLTPAIDESFPHPIFIFFFVAHGAILWAVAAMLGMGFRPDRGFVLRAFFFTNGIAAVVGTINWLIGSNYMFLCGPPENPSVYDYFGPWPISLLSLEALGLVMLLIVAAPFALLKERRLPDAI